MFIDFVIFRGQFRTALYRSHVYFKWRSRFSGTHAIPGSSESFPQEDEVTAGHQTTMRCTWPHGGLSVYEPAVVCVCVCWIVPGYMGGRRESVCFGERFKAKSQTRFPPAHKLPIWQKHFQFTNGHSPTIAPFLFFHNLHPIRVPSSPFHSHSKHWHNHVVM